MIRFYVIGMNDCPDPNLDEEVRAIIQKGSYFSGGKRHYERVKELLPENAQWIDITVPLDNVFKAYSDYSEIVVFASGDPLFYGFANTLQREFPDAEMHVYPTFNSLQILAHKFIIPYQDMRIVSLTGRPWKALDIALIERASLIGILTDRTHTPEAIAKRLLEYGYQDYNFYIGEQLGHPIEERLTICSVEEAIDKSFTFPNCLILKATKDLPIRPFGIPDDKFDHLNGRHKMITKMSVRLLDLQCMDLRSRSHLWDVGFCTGSVSIEAKLQFPHLEIDAFEIREDGAGLIYSNSRRFGTPGINVHIGDFCVADLSAVPAPDIVFIGGHGGQLAEMVKRIASCLQPQGAIVFNSVSEDSRMLFYQAITQAGMLIDYEMQLSVNAYNPITICRAIFKLN